MGFPEVPQRLVGVLAPHRPGPRLGGERLDRAVGPPDQPVVVEEAGIFRIAVLGPIEEVEGALKQQLVLVELSQAIEGQRALDVQVRATLQPVGLRRIGERTEFVRLRPGEDRRGGGADVEAAKRGLGGRAGLDQRAREQPKQ